eukprot:TRINITY_DN57029_c0_g1_i1.p1 TRINITY_DN57029_c0_g1~~TRINITY_DN57029_c0_g1_i1.p1  ORF type:complete len:620 (+),score=104.36 TRINITY_DN57029_c0_g1_i1:39-1862(+)
MAPAASSSAALQRVLECAAGADVQPMLMGLGAQVLLNAAHGAVRVEDFDLNNEEAKFLIQKLSVFKAAPGPPRPSKRHALPEPTAPDPAPPPPPPPGPPPCAYRRLSIPAAAQPPGSWNTQAASDKKSTPAQKLSLETALSNIRKYAREPEGSRVLQSAWQSAAKDTQMTIVDAVLNDNDMISLCRDAHANYLVQKLFEGTLIDDERATLFAKKLEGQAIALANHKHGCRVLQTAMQHLPADLLTRLIQEMLDGGCLTECIGDPNGNHVVQRLVQMLTPDLASSFIAYCSDTAGQITTNEYGCRIIQRLIEKCEELDMMYELGPVLDMIVSGAGEFAIHPHANYVLQCALEHGRAEDKVKIIEHMCENVAELACNKYSSNVIEKCFKIHVDAEEVADARSALVHRVVGGAPDDGDSLIPAIAQDKFGGFVIRSVINHVIAHGLADLEARIRGVAEKVTGPGKDRIMAALNGEEQPATAPKRETKGSKHEKQWVSKDGGGGWSNDLKPPYKMFVGGLPHECDEQVLGDYFGSYGDITQVLANRGFGFVTFSSADALGQALADYDEHTIAGKWVEVKQHQEKKNSQGWKGKREGEAQSDGQSKRAKPWQ